MQLIQDWEKILNLRVLNDFQKEISRLLYFSTSFSIGLLDVKDGFEDVDWFAGVANNGYASSLSTLSSESNSTMSDWSFNNESYFLIWIMACVLRSFSVAKSFTSWASVWYPPFFSIKRIFSSMQAFRGRQPYMRTNSLGRSRVLTAEEIVSSSTM